MNKSRSISFEFIPSQDPVRQAASLQIRIVENDKIINQFTIDADDATSSEDRQAIALFAFEVEQEVRKAKYRREHPGNDEYVHLELQLDRYEWFFRQRRDRERYAGLGDAAVREWRMQA